jgi:fumarate reductase (CoM/CoB) subunit B
MEKGKVKIFRYNPEVDRKPYYADYEFPFEPGMSVLDVVFHVYEKIDGTFSFSYCCRNSHCGLCGAKINGRPGLMCRESATPEMVLEPLDNLPVLRDLVVNRDDYEGAMRGLRLFLDRVNVPPVEPERIEIRDLDRFKVASRCVECYSCVSTCPSFRESKHDFLGPAGMVQLARHAFDPRDELNRELMAYSSGLYNCTLCGECSVVCPHEIRPKDNIELLREKLVDKGQAPRAIAQLVEMVRTSRKAILPPKRRKPFLEENTDSAAGTVGLFVGCNMDYDPNLMPVAAAACKVLLKLGFDLSVPPEQVCCGAPLKEVGATEQIGALTRINVEAFEKAGCSHVLTLCAGCAVAAKNGWPEVYRKETGRDLPFEVQDFTEFLAGHAGLSAGLKALKMKVTYHDPCLLKRGLGITEEPRQLLRHVPEMEFVEMEQPDYCCSGGGGLRVTNFEMSKRILKRKMSFMKNLDIDAVVTCCPTCMKQLKIGLSQERLERVKVLHPATVLARSMGLE